MHKIPISNKLLFYCGKKEKRWILHTKNYFFMLFVSCKFSWVLAEPYFSNWQVMHLEIYSANLNNTNSKNHLVVNRNIVLQCRFWKISDLLVNHYWHQTQHFLSIFRKFRKWQKLCHFQKCHFWIHGKHYWHHHPQHFPWFSKKFKRDCRSSEP